MEIRPGTSSALTCLKVLKHLSGKYRAVPSVKKVEKVVLAANSVMDADEVSSYLTCAVCNEVYSSREYKPLILPCGHTYCSLCLQRVQANGELVCPTCRKSHRNTLVEDLPLNYSLLSISENVPQSQEICSSHNETIRFWCAKCISALCDECLISSHRGDGHNIERFQDYLHNKKKQSVKDLNDIMDNIYILQQNTTHNVNESVFNIVLADKVRKDVLFLKSEVASYRESLQTDSQYFALTKCDDRIKMFQENLNRLSSFNGYIKKSFSEMREKFVEFPGESIVKDIPAAYSLNNTSVNDSNKHVLESDLLKNPSLSIAAFDGRGRYASMEWHNHKLHIYSFSQQNASPDVLIKWDTVEGMVPTENPEVFLELAAKEQSLGKVYIKLRGQLRRAQHFLALCVGSRGPTYSGMRFMESRSWKSGEVMIGGSYSGAHGGKSMRGLMKNLEWGGESEGQCKEGDLIAFSKGNPEIDSVFALVTKSTEGSHCKCIFGEVVSGLDVVKMASHIEPIRRVRISGCGVILPVQGN
ncbi:hypothetical protein SK128_024127 [Halocaridina rubra]|uniref:Uncharacterized protein n=1 Tax=Halocaridina rubra TaxID=373956 RepID=A0AAN8XQE1_HALRR